MTKIVCTLPQIFHSFISSWRHVPQAEQTLAALTTSLLQEERALSKWRMIDRMSEEAPALETAMAAQAPSFPLPNNRGTFSRGRGRGRGASHSLREWSEKPSQQLCGYCNKLNHEESECRTRQRHERAMKEMAEMRKSIRSDSGNVAVEETDGFMDILGQDFSLISLSTRFATRSTGDYFADSGATQHMTDQYQLRTTLSFVFCVRVSHHCRWIGAVK